MARLSGVTQVELIAKKERNLDTICYRGDAPLAYLALISKADVYDAVTNPKGLQRDLSPSHAAKAYEYAKRPKNPEVPRAFPEIVLNVRGKDVVTIERITVSGGDGATIDSTQQGQTDGAKLVRLRFNLAKLNHGRVQISRVDGNHRLFFAAGDERRDPILSSAPFQIHVGLTREQESSLFVDINANQKGLNSSHLSVLRSNLTPEEQEIKDHLARWIARQLAEKDPQSPWHGLIHMGGSKVGARTQGLTRPVNFASLEAGVGRTLAKSQYIHDVTQPAAQYELIRRYWSAVKQVFAEEWAQHKEYLILKNIGVMSLSILGGTIVDRCLARRQVDVEAMVFYLKQAKARFDWKRDASGNDAIAGMSGNRAALIIAGEMAGELRDEDEESRAMHELTKSLLGSSDEVSA